jgi:ATP-dependent DNA helicase RecG
VFLAGSLTKTEKERVYERLRLGTADLVVGTHALLQEKVQFKNLGLAIVDEQHRFGVKQREILKSFGTPHLLSLTATPIPRTLALTIYGDQEVSILDELPAGRSEIVTRVVPESKRDDAYVWIETQVKAGRQAFVVCPLIQESEELQLKSVIAEYERLNSEVFPDLVLGLLHGKMKQKEKDAVMEKFANNEIQILVSTTVVEVGIDVPNATIMVIEGADRFGLAQLHQLRGRVGRGEHQSYCFLFPEGRGEEVRQRMQAMTEYSDGFRLAEIDLELRGPGEVYGVKQSGIPDLKMASFNDKELIGMARALATKVIDVDPELKSNPHLLDRLANLDREFGVDY